MDNIYAQENLIHPNIGISMHVTAGSMIMHSHSHYEILYVLHGSMEHTFNDQKQTLTRGDCVILSPKAMHSFRAIDTYNKRDIMVSTEYFDKLLELLPLKNHGLNEFGINTPVKFSIPELSELEDISRNFVNETDIDKKKLLGFNLLLKIFTKFICQESTHIENIYHPIVQQIITDLGKNKFIVGGIPTIMQDVSYSPSYVRNVFKKEMGMPLSDYIKDIRLKHIAYYLNTTNIPLQEICNLVGIDSTSYVTKIFKQKYGVSPIKYRNRFANSRQNNS